MYERKEFFRLCKVGPDGSKEYYNTSGEWSSDPSVIQIFDTEEDAASLGSLEATIEKF